MVDATLHAIDEIGGHGTKKTKTDNPNNNDFRGDPVLDPRSDPGSGI